MEKIHDILSPWVAAYPIVSILGRSRLGLAWAS